MTVAYLLGSLNRGGTETLVLDTFRNAQKAGYQMIGIYRHEGAYLTDFQQTGVPFIHCAVKKHRFITYFLQLRKVLLQNNVQIVHAQQFIDCLYAKLATLGTSIKIVETFHGYDFDASWLNRRLIDLSMRLADRVCFVSMNEKEYYLKAYNKKDSDKYQVVYNGISFDKLDQQYEEPDFLQQTPSTAENLTKIDPPQAGITHYRLRMAMVGNFVSVRSQSIVCRAIDLLAQRGVSDFDFYFIGRRNEQEPWRYDDCVTFCRDRHLNHVHFMGGRADVPAILQHLDAFVYSRTTAGCIGNNRLAREIISFQ